MERVGEDGCLLRFPSSAGAHRALRRIESRPPAGIRDLVPGAASLLVVLDAWDQAVASLLETLEHDPEPAGQAEQSVATHVIAVRYGGDDLADVARLAGLGEDEVVRLHAGAAYRVAFLGFQPGFAYLEGLPEAIRTPRLTAPRARVPAGSVAIGGEWTGVYPAVSPGGWRLIGTGELVLFDPRRSPPSLLAPGDRVRFVPAEEGR